MIKNIIYAGITFSLLSGNVLMAQNLGTLPAPGPHFNVTVSKATITVTTNTPNHFYPNAGIKFITPGVKASGAVRLQSDGSYLFSVSDTSATTINFLSQGGPVQFELCLNGVGKKYSCERQSATVFGSHVIFVTSTFYSGNLGGIAGADAICQAAAYGPNSIVSPPGLNFKALLIGPTRYPCSSKDGGFSGSCGGSFALNWPLVPGTKYVYANGNAFNTVNANGVFNGVNRDILDEIGSAPGLGDFWTGIQSILSNPAGKDILGWAYTDMNKAADGVVYTTYLANCNEFTSSSNLLTGTSGSIGQGPTSSGVIPGSTWGNATFFDDSMSTVLFNLFNTGLPNTCDTLLPIVCVSE